MRHLLLAKGLWGLVDGTEILAESANAQAQTEFQRKSQRAFSTIVLAISTQQLYLITSCEQPIRMRGMLQVKKPLRTRDFGKQTFPKETIL